LFFLHFSVLSVAAKEQKKPVTRFPQPQMKVVEDEHANLS